MTCCAKKEYISEPLYYAWSAAWPCYPKDNLKCSHKCFKPVIRKNFLRKNKEAILIYRKNYLKHVEKKARMNKMYNTRMMPSQKSQDANFQP